MVRGEDKCSAVVVAVELLKQTHSVLDTLVNHLNVVQVLSFIHTQHTVRSQHCITF